MSKDIQAYNSAQSNGDRQICDLLADQIRLGLPEANGKAWHGGPVWFIDGNPIVGYWARKKRVQLLFWSGQSFDEAGLRPEGKFKAAEASYTAADQVDTNALRR